MLLNRIQLRLGVYDLPHFCELNAKARRVCAGPVSFPTVLIVASGPKLNCQTIFGADVTDSVESGAGYPHLQGLTGFWEDGKGVF
jgi:hypothetical protein